MMNPAQMDQFRASVIEEEGTEWGLMPDWATTLPLTDA
jgi:hypothetical protein